MSCNQMPPIIEFSTFSGNYQKYEDATYEAYKETFEANEFFWEGKPIYHKKYPLYKDKPGTFWHIVSNGKDEQNRTPDLRRYERVTWPAIILSYCKNNCNNLLVWKNIRHGQNRVVMWCRDIDYVVILNDRKDFFLFWTAYPITYKHTNEKLLKEYTAYKNSLSS